MNNGGFAVTNLAAAAVATLSVSGSFDATNFPSTNLKDYSNQPVWRASAKTGAWIKVDLGSALTVKLAALINHNLTSGATVTLEANATDSWGAPSYSQALTWRSPHIFLVLNQTYRWWRVTISDAGNTYYPSIGEFFIGSLTAFTLNFNFPTRSKSHIGKEHATDAGMRFGYNISNAKTYEIAWTVLSTTNLAEPQSMHDLSYDGVLPILFLPDTADTELIYGKLNGPLAYTEIGPALVGNVRQSLIELPNGIFL